MGAVRGQAHPSEFLPEARRLYQDIVSAEDLGISTAEADQIEAANRDARRIFKELAAVVPHRIEIASETDVTPESLSWVMALGVALAARGTTRCEHVRKSRSDQPAAAFLHAGVVVCGECWRSGRVPLLVNLPDDDRCDLCNAPGCDLREVACEVGPLLFLMEICDRCYEFSTQLGVGGE
jgi:hypothetical protein